MVVERFARGARAAGVRGWGLPVVRAVAEAHGGTVRLEPGSGATSVVEMPLGNRPVTARHTP